MKYKKALTRSAVIISILAASVLIGFICQKVGNLIDIHNQPREYSEFVEKYSVQYGVPEHIIYAVIKYESGFVSNTVRDDGGVGLMGLSNEDFDKLLKLTGENLTHGILYDPETNIKYGTYLLSYLYNSYGKWKPVFCAKIGGKDVVDNWIADKNNIDENGYLVKYPDSALESESEKIIKIMNKYYDLYYEAETSDSIES